MFGINSKYASFVFWSRCRPRSKFTFIKSGLIVKSQYISKLKLFHNIWCLCEILVWSNSFRTFFEGILIDHLNFIFTVLSQMISCCSLQKFRPVFRSFMDLISICWSSVMNRLHIVLMNMECELVLYGRGHYDYFLAWRLLVLIWIINVLEFSRFEILDRVIFLSLNIHNFVCRDDFMLFLCHFSSRYFVIIDYFDNLRRKLLNWDFFKRDSPFHHSVRTRFGFFKKIVCSCILINIVFCFDHFLSIIRSVRFVSWRIRWNNFFVLRGFQTWSKLIVIYFTMNIDILVHVDFRSFIVFNYERFLCVSNFIVPFYFQISLFTIFHL